MQSQERAAERLGSRVADKYRLDRVLGVGGMGAVYEALHLYTERRVAVKLLHPAFLEGSSVTAKRFMLEAKAAAAIQHPAVVEVLDAGEADGAPYVVFELLAGVTLSTALLERHLDQGDLIDLVSQVLEMLELAHARGIIHRDLKPENVFVCRDPDGAVRAKVLDFGIARRLDQPLGEELTQAGAVLGTPFYMSPEQMQGEAVDGRADLWALGAILFRGLSGHIPFESRNFTALLAEVLSRGAPPLAVHRPELPAALRDVVDRALARRLDDRWTSASAMRRALAPFRRAPRGFTAQTARLSAPPLFAAPATPAHDTLPPSVPVPGQQPAPSNDRASAAPRAPREAAPAHALDEAARRDLARARRAAHERDANARARDPAAWERALGEIEGEIEALRARGTTSAPARPSVTPTADPDARAWLGKLFPPKKGPS